MNGPSLSHRNGSSGRLIKTDAAYVPLAPIGDTTTASTAVVTTLFGQGTASRVILMIVSIASCVAVGLGLAAFIMVNLYGPYGALNIGTQGVGLFKEKRDDKLRLRNVAPGNHTTVVLDLVGDNVVVDVDMFSLPGIEIVTLPGLLGGQLILLGGSATLSLAQAQSFTMLTVSGDTLLGNQTSCIKPLLASCIEIGGRDCDTPVGQSCMPTNVTFDTATINNLIVLNSSTIIVSDLIIGNATTYEDFNVVNLHLTGQQSCMGLGAIGNECLNLGGYVCPMGVPLSESCIPATMIFYDLSATNNLNVNQMTCLGGPLNDICIGGTDAAVAGAIIRRDGTASFAAHIATLDQVALPATTTSSFGLDFGGDANLYRVDVNALRMDYDLGVRHMEFRNTGGTVPTVTLGAGAGTGAFAILAPGSNDCNMKVQVIMGTAPQAIALIFRITYITPFTSGYIPRPVFSGAFSVNYVPNYHISPPYINAETESYFEFYQGQSQAFIGNVQYNWNFMIC